TPHHRGLLSVLFKTLVVTRTHSSWDRDAFRNAFGTTFQKSLTRCRSSATSYQPCSTSSELASPRNDFPCARLTLEPQMLP
ncbi:hypothetical protein EDD22DRAFT_877571, partial [Suillus occidentalis]